MATFLLFDEAVRLLLVPVSGANGGPVDFSTDVFKIALGPVASAPDQAADSLLSDFTQITSAGSYAVQTATTPAISEPSSGVFQFTTDDIPFTASGGNFDTFRYIVMYDDDITTPLDLTIGFLDYGSNVDLVSGNTFTVNVGANGWFQISVPNS